MEKTKINWELLKERQKRCCPIPLTEEEIEELRQDAKEAQSIFKALRDKDNQLKAR